jgi:hypothetical protein
MRTLRERKPERDSAQTAVHISNTHQILKALEEKTASIQNSAQPLRN